MAQVITTAGEQLFAIKAQNNQPLDIDTFIFAYVPGQDSSAAIDRNEGLPPVGQRVHQQIVQQRGRVNSNVVIYSTVMDSITGPFEFNWVGLYSSVNNTLVAISKIPTVVKTVTVPGTAGNILNRNFGIEYSGIADLDGITVDPETWQLDYTARLNGMDELTRQLAADMNGRDWFIDNGFKVAPLPTPNNFKVTAGAGYVSGLRIAIEEEPTLIAASYPQFVYVNAWFDGTSEATWKGQTTFQITPAEQEDYTDETGKRHYLFKLATITAADTVIDHRSGNATSPHPGIKYLLKVPGIKQTTLSLHTGLGVGGAEYVWLPDADQSQHLKRGPNGGILFSSEAINLYDGTPATLNALLSGGFTGMGCFEQITTSISEVNFGAVPNNDNLLAIRAAIEYCNTYKKPFNVEIDNYTTDVIRLPSDIEIIFDGGRIDNIGTISSLRKAVFMAGHWHPEMYGSRAIGAITPYVRQVDRYRCTGVVTSNQTSITLVNASDASNFIAEELYFIATDESYPQTGTGVDIDLPSQSSVIKCKTSDSSTGVVTFYDSIDFNSVSAPWLCKLRAGEENQSFQIYLAKNITIKNANGSGRSLLGLTSCCYNLDVDKWSGHYSYIIQLNGLIKSKMKGFLGTFDLSAIEIKFCTNNADVADIKGTCLTDGTGTPVGLISYGEGAKNLDIHDFKIVAPKFAPASNPIIQQQPGINCKIYDGLIYTPLCDRQPIQFYSDSRSSLENCHVANLEIYSASRLGIRMGGNYGAYTPKNCTAKNIKLYTSYAGVDSMYLIRFEHSNDCEISACSSPNLKIIDILNGSVNPICFENVTGPSGSLSGTNSGLLGIRDNKSLELTGPIALGTDKKPRTSFGTNAAPACSVEGVGAGRFMGQDVPTSGTGTEVGYDQTTGVGYAQARNRSTSEYMPYRIFGSIVDIFVGAFQSVRFSIWGTPTRFDIINSDADPEGIVSAPIGSVCSVKFGGTASLWFKSGGGSGNTGWHQVPLL
jgi:hypothetical protein